MATLLLAPNAASDDQDKILHEICKHCQTVLPSYAVPLFLRLKYDMLEMTSTIKQTKVSLKQEAFDVDVIGDKVFYLSRQEKCYKELTPEIYKGLSEQRIKF